ncbi:dna polymerase iv kappa [Stylonychia lemnae]|uniref:DNA polymerase kappa n=1 Tax=Stylonychia lemnae TaxID=5949 RepID=A0A078AHU8_STYLE|nr:dna polymerase iv kappa [Stylonychia lemnae]|eukprot:CDW81824.1 dna polymerase iv kappa [Stylonychia lemnae]
MKNSDSGSSLKSSKSYQQSSNNLDLQLECQDDSEIDILDVFYNNPSLLNSQNQIRKSQVNNAENSAQLQEFQLEFNENLDVDDLELTPTNNGCEVMQVKQTQKSNTKYPLMSQQSFNIEEGLDDLFLAEGDDFIESQDNLMNQGIVHEVQIDTTTVTKRRSDQPALHYVAHKAGMDDIDKDKIQQMIIDASKGSSYYTKEMERTQAAKEKAQTYKQKIDQCQKNQKSWDAAKKNVKSLINEIEKDRDYSRTWVHIDMDMFYAAVEIRDEPSLADVPLAIGGDSMISTANYVARKYGVRSAMPGFIARKLCPQLVFRDCNFKKYTEVSKVFKKILEEYDPSYESMGLDEANLDLTGYLMNHGLGTEEEKRQVALEIRTRINEATQLTCSAGIACNKMLAKICTDMNKPNGQYYLQPDKEAVMDFVNKLSVRKIPGIGRMTELVLQQFEIYTCQQVIEKATEIHLIFSEKTSYFLIRAALGISRNFHEEDDDDACQKSISVSTTFSPIHKLEQFKEKIKEICEDLAQRMDKRKLGGLTLTLELKSTQFELVNKSVQLKSYIWTQEDLTKHSHQILEQLWPYKAVRLLGVKMSHLKNLHEIKRDKSLSSFFNKGLSKDEYAQQQQKQLEQLGKRSQLNTGQSKKSNNVKITTPPTKKQGANSHVSGGLNSKNLSLDLNKQRKISAFVTKSSNVPAKNPLSDHDMKSNLNDSDINDQSVLIINDDEEKVEDVTEFETHQKIKSQTVQNTKKRTQPFGSPINTSNTKVKGKSKRIRKDSKASITGSIQSIKSFFQKKDQ